MCRPEVRVGAEPIAQEREVMKTIGVLIVALFTLTGCATTDMLQSGESSGGAVMSSLAPSPADTPDISFPSQSSNIGPSLVIPATGGAPVVGLPLGPDLYLPVTGGPPIVGISTTP